LSTVSHKRQEKFITLLAAVEAIIFSQEGCSSCLPGLRFSKERPMSIETVTGTGLKYHLIAYDKNGEARDDDRDGLMNQVALDALTTAGNESVTDELIISHGWKGDIPSAKDQYNRWINAMADCTDDIERMRQSPQGFRPLLIKEGGGASGAHSDLAKPEVAHAFWEVTMN
jgi:hypothetical protein